MSRYFLTKLLVKGFRGVNNEGDPLELKFVPDKVNSVYADNGYGKSSIYEALSYAIFDREPKPEDLEQREDSKAYYNNRYCSWGLVILILGKRVSGDQIDRGYCHVRWPGEIRTPKLAIAQLKATTIIAEPFGSGEEALLAGMRTNYRSVAWARRRGIQKPSKNESGRRDVTQLRRH